MSTDPKPAAVPPAATPSAAGTPAAPPPAGPCVLVVDDNAEVRAMVCAALREQGISCVEAASAEEALRQILGRRFDAAAIDLVMPGTHGLQLLAEIRRTQNGADLPAVVLSALPQGSTRESARAHMARIGRAEFLDKPVTGRHLAAALGRLLSS